MRDETARSKFQSMINDIARLPLFALGKSRASRGRKEKEKKHFHFQIDDCHSSFHRSLEKCDVRDKHTSVYSLTNNKLQLFFSLISSLRVNIECVVFPAAADRHAAREFLSFLHQQINHTRVNCEAPTAATDIAEEVQRRDTARLIIVCMSRR